MNQQDKAAAGAVSIDAREFRLVVKPEVIGLIRFQQAVAHIDAHAAQRYEAGFQDGLKHAHQQALTVTHVLMAERDEARASLARLVAGVEGLARWDRRFDIMEISVDGDFFDAADLLALLPAKAETKCGCTRCLDENGETVELFPGLMVPVSSQRMVLCATCGNKRCSHANDHRNACTGSNEPGQPGSAYAAPARPITAPVGSETLCDICDGTGTAFGKRCGCVVTIKGDPA